MSWRDLFNPGYDDRRAARHTELETIRAEARIRGLKLQYAAIDLAATIGVWKLTQPEQYAALPAPVRKDLERCLATIKSCLKDEISV